MLAAFSITGRSHDGGGNGHPYSERGGLPGGGDGPLQRKFPEPSLRNVEAPGLVGAQSDAFVRGVPLKVWQLFMTLPVPSCDMEGYTEYRVAWQVQWGYTGSVRSSTGREPRLHSSRGSLWPRLMPLTPAIEGGCACYWSQSPKPSQKPN